MQNVENKKEIFKKKSKNIWRFLFLIFVLSFIVLNWSDIYWIFNFRVAPKGIQTLINQEKEKEEEISFYDKENSIEIPVINITAPIITSEGSSNEHYEEALKKGVVHFSDSVFPGEKGATIILGHSAPSNWPKIDYDWVFSDLQQLEEKDKIAIYFKNRMYTYEVSEKIFLEIGQDIPSYASNEPELVLLSCWPPGKNIKRIGIRATLIQ